MRRIKHTVVEGGPAEEAQSHLLAALNNTVDDDSEFEGYHGDDGDVQIDEEEDKDPPLPLPVIENCKC